MHALGRPCDLSSATVVWDNRLEDVLKLPRMIKRCHCNSITKDGPASASVAAKAKNTKLRGGHPIPGTWSHLGCPSTGRGQLLSMAHRSHPACGLFGCSLSDKCGFCSSKGPQDKDYVQEAAYG